MEVATRTLTVNTNAPTLATFNWSGIDEVRISSGGESHFALDDLSFSFATVTLADLQPSLTATAAGARMTLSAAGTVLNGGAKSDGTYLLAEALTPLREDLWATLGIYDHRGDSAMRRGYLNAGAQDYSFGTPGVATRGVRLRLDWENAWRAAGVEFSPYADLSYAESKLAAYTESGGGFPARFDARREKSTELRLGAHAAHPLAGGMKLVSMLEAAHRLEKSGARTTGEVIGLFNFDLAGPRNKRDWLRAGIGVEGRIAEGTGSLMLNATTLSEAPNVWLAANWQKAF